MQETNLNKALAKHDIRIHNHHIDKDHILVNDKKVFLTREQFKEIKKGE